MSNIFTVVGDPHLTNKNQDKMSLVTSKVEELKHPTVWLGDMLDTKEVIRGKSLNFWYSYFQKSNLEHVVLVGNHDWFNLECEDHSLQVLKNLPNVTVVDAPLVSGKVGFVPYIHDPEKLKGALGKVSEAEVLFAHLETEGFDFGNGYICEEGTKISTLKNFKKVISGHFHKYQEKKNLVYLGTPFSHSFGESNQDKYLGLLNVDSLSLELLPTQLPQHRTYEIDVDDNPEIPDMCPENYNRLFLKGKQDNIDVFKTKIEDPNIRVIGKPTDEGGSEEVLTEDQSNLKQFQRWAKEIKGLDVPTTELGLQILEGLGE